MEIITVRTSQNIDIDYEVGGLGERILARLIDFGIFVPFIIVGVVLISAIGEIGVGIYFVTLLIIYTFYDLACEVFLNGQSAGKLVMKIKVISIDGSRPKFSQFLLRWLFRMVDFTLTGGLAALLTAALSEKGQRVGDLVAGTAMIKTKPRTKMDHIIFAPMDDTYIPLFPQVSQLTDKDIALVHEVIQSFIKTGSNVPVYNLAERLKQMLSATPPQYMNNLLFLQTVVKDYSHVTAQSDAIL